MEKEREKKNGDKKERNREIRNNKEKNFKRKAMWGRRREKKERKCGSILKTLSLWVCRHCWRRGGGLGHCATIII